jgi:hypothetical protein
MQSAAGRASARAQVNILFDLSRIVGTTAPKKFARHAALKPAEHHPLDMQPGYSYRLSVGRRERRAGGAAFVVASRGVVAAFIAVAGVMACAASEEAAAGAPAQASFLLFSGTDIWRYGAFLYGGLIWSPAGVDADGFTFKLLLDGGQYSYVSSELQESIGGTKLSAAALPGWRFTREGLTVTLFAGPVAQNYRLTPADPGSRLHGFHLGGESAADIWYQPNANTMAALNGAIASIGPTGYVRAAFGYRLFAPAFVGPEIEEFWCGDFQEIEFGAHVTGLHIDSLDWSMGSGFALTSDQRSGPYVRLGVSARY